MAIELDDGTIVRSLPEQVSYNDERIEETQTKLTALEIQIQAALAGVLHYKGSVATYADLPATGNEVGDVWNVLDTGKNYAWSGTVWDELGGTVDLSHLVTLDTEQTISGQKTFTADVKIGTNGISLYDRSGELAIADSYGDYLVIGQYTNCQTSFIPHDDNTYDIGSSTYKWKEVNAYTIKLGSSGVLTYDNGTFSINDDLIPDDNDSYSLGSDTKYFNKIYTTNIQIGSGGFIINSGGSNKIGIGSNVSIYNANLLINTNNAYDIGRSGVAWRNLYLAGTFYLPNAIMRANEANKFYIGDGLGTARFAFTLGGGSFNFYPLVNTTNLGTSSYKWNDLYLGGNLSDGTNTVTIADLAALIAYAKAQGWIS